MRRLFLLIALVLFSIAVGYSFARNNFSPKESSNSSPVDYNSRKPILRFALLADSHSDSANLEKALAQAQGFGINFVIGLGDWSTVGTLDELKKAKDIFDQSKIPYYVTAGDHDLWDSRNRGEDPLNNFREVFGESTQQIERGGIQIVLLDNSDIYSGISQESWEILNSKLENRKSKPQLKFVMAHKTPFHPESKHVMGEDSAEVAKQAKMFLDILVNSKVGGFFSGDLHFFAQFKDPSQTVKITTVGAVTKERNFQGPRFAIVTVYDDYSWNVEDVEVR